LSVNAKSVRIALPIEVEKVIENFQVNRFLEKNNPLMIVFVLITKESISP
jgi:hypothetical protein